MVQQFKEENGVRLPLTDKEQAEYDAQQLAWAAAKEAEQGKEALPDIAAQVALMASALVANGISLPDNVLAAANVQLAANGQPAIAVPTTAGGVQLGVQNVTKTLG